MTYERSKEMKKELSWLWYFKGSRKRGFSRKIKVAKVKIIFFCQNHAVVDVVIVVAVKKWKYVIFQDPGIVNVVAKLILLLTRKTMSFVLITTYERIVIWKRKCYYNVAGERSSEIEIKCIFIKVYGVVSVVEN